ncbi:hypothetical protein MAHJHV45_41670 [Mycobacterium avium subsp. hominissuis]
MLGLQARQRVEVAGPGEGLPRGADRLGQRCFRQVHGLITHAATLSLLTRLYGLPASAPRWVRFARLLLGRYANRIVAGLGTMVIPRGADAGSP